MLKIICHMNLISFHRASLYWFGGFGHSLDENDANLVCLNVGVNLRGWDGFPGGFAASPDCNLVLRSRMNRIYEVCCMCYPGSSQPLKVAPSLRSSE